MVATGIRLPNIRKLFIPDEGYLVCDVDLSGADAQVVTWEAGDEDLKNAFRKGLKLHLKNSRDLFPHETQNMTDEELKATDHPGGFYHDVKRSVHATNYGGSARTIAIKLKWPVARAEEFQERWFYLHPGIREWHNRTWRHLHGTECWKCRTPTEDPTAKCHNCNASLGRTVRNAFRYRIIYFDRVEGILPEALAWIPQSTVANNTTRGLILLEDTFPFIEMLLQVHDSLVFQIPKRKADQLPQVQAKLNTIITPYEDPLQIPWGISVSEKSWGDVEAWKPTSAAHSAPREKPMDNPDVIPRFNHGGT